MWYSFLSLNAHYFICFVCFVMPFAFHFQRVQVGSCIQVSFYALSSSCRNEKYNNNRTGNHYNQGKKKSEQKMYVEKWNATECSTEILRLQRMCIVSECIAQAKQSQNRISKKVHKEKKTKEKCCIMKTEHFLCKCFFFLYSWTWCWFPLFELRCSLIHSLRLAIASLMHIIILFAK